MLNGDVISIDARQAHIQRTSLAIHAIGKREPAIGIGCNRCQCGGTLRQGKYTAEIVRCTDALVSQYRQVLGDVVTEDGSESAERIAPAVAGADHGLRRELISDAEARRQVSPVHVLNAVVGDLSHSEDVDQARAEVKLSAIAGFVDGLG